MTWTKAMAEAQKLRDAILARGVKKVSIEILEGRGGSGWIKSTHIATMGHHTVSRRSHGLTPCLRLVKVGRTGIPGPLCNGYGGFDEIARIICMAWANHPGEGGPYRTPSGTIPLNNGRPYTFGWEFEGGLDLADFTPSYKEFMARCMAGTLDYLGHDVRYHLEHRTWAPTRKVDRLGYSLEEARSEISKAMEEEEMTKTQARLELAAAWHAKSGVWMTPSATESAQIRLTRLALEVVTKSRTIEQIVFFAPQKSGPVASEPIPSWVIDPTVPAP